MAVHVTLFNDTWYHSIINQTLSKGSDEASADARIVAEAVLTGLCCIAQSLDHVTDSKNPDSVVRAIESIGSNIAEAIENKE